MHAIAPSLPSNADPAPKKDRKKYSQYDIKILISKTYLMQILQRPKAEVIRWVGLYVQELASQKLISEPSLVQAFPTCDATENI